MGVGVLLLLQLLLLLLLLPPGATAASLQDGVAWAWGLEDALGQPPADGPPVEVGALDNAVARVAAGADHSVVLRASGAVHTFGRGARGQLGHGDRAARSTPSRVASSLLGSNIAHVAAGTHFTTVVKLTGRRAADGGAGSIAWQLYSWGTNDWGQLGIGTHSSASYDAPRSVSSLTSAALAGTGAPGDVASLTSGAKHTVAVLRDGRAFGWGSNRFGALGRSCYSPQTANVAGCAVVRPELLSVGAATVLRGAALGGDHSLLLDQAGKLWAAGRNLEGQLGLGDTVDRFAFATVPVPGRPQILQVAAGALHSLAVGGNGQIWAWGTNQYGELALGSTSSGETSPTAVAVHTVQASTVEATAIALAAWALLFGAFAADSAAIGAMRIAAGDGFSLFAVDGGHTVIGVGRSEGGQLGASCSYPVLMSLNPRISRCPPSVLSGGWQTEANSCVDLSAECGARKDTGECAISARNFGYVRKL